MPSGRVPRLVKSVVPVVKSNSFQSLLVFGLKSLGGLSGYLLFALVARKSGEEQFGNFSIVFSAAMMAGFAGSFGQQVFLVKEIASAQHRRDAASEMKAYTYSAVSTGFGALTASAVFYFTISVLPVKSDQVTAVGGAILTFAFAASQTTLGALRIQEKTIIAVATRDLLWRVLAAGTIASIAHITPGNRISSAVALSSMAVTLLVIVALHVSIIVRSFPGRLRLPGIPLFWHWFKMSLGLTLVAVISSADLYVFSIALGRLLPTPEVGAFFAAMKTVEVINLLLMAVALVTGPRLAREIAAGNSRSAQAVCNAAIVVQGVPAAVACGAVIAAAPQLLGVFDQGFVEYSNVLRVLTIGVLINAFAGPTVLMLQLLNLHWRQVLLQGGSLVGALALLPTLTTNFGLVGAAYAFVVSKTAWNAAAVLASRSKLGVDPSCLGLLGSGALSLRESANDIYNRLKGIIIDKSKV